MEYSCARISVGMDAIHRSECSIRFDKHSFLLEYLNDELCQEDLIFSYTQIKKIFSLDSLLCDEKLCYPEDIRFMIAIRVSSSIENGLQQMVDTNKYLNDQSFNMLLLDNGTFNISDSNKAFITIEFAYETDFNSVIELLPLSVDTMTKYEYRFIAKSLIKDGNDRKYERMATMSLPLQQSHTEMIYPFPYGFDVMDDICMENDLDELWFKSNSSHALIGTKTISSLGTDSVSIGPSELQRLTEGKTPIESYMNDMLVNFFHVVRLFFLLSI